MRDGPRIDELRHRLGSIVVTEIEPADFGRKPPLNVGRAGHQVGRPEQRQPCRLVAGRNHRRDLVGKPIRRKHSTALRIPGLSTPSFSTIAAALTHAHPMSKDTISTFSKFSTLGLRRYYAKSALAPLASSSIPGKARAKFAKGAKRLRLSLNY